MPVLTELQGFAKLQGFRQLEDPVPHTELPAVVYGRQRDYDVPQTPPRRDVPMKCSCGWRGMLSGTVLYRDALGSARCCPQCGVDLEAYL